MRHGVSRVSLGAQSFRAHLLSVLERRATPDDVRRAVHTLRDAGFDNISLDLIYGIPGQSAADLDADLADALALEPEHLSCYELEAKPGTRFTHAHGAELRRQAEAMERYAERVAETLTGAGYRWYETANYCRTDPGRDLRAHHNLAIWRGADYLGVGVGAVSTLGGVRRRNLPSVGRYVAALGRGEEPPRELEPLDPETRGVERLMLGLRLDEPFAIEDAADVVDVAALERLVAGRARRAPGRRRAPHRAGPPARRCRHGRAARLSRGSSGSGASRAAGRPTLAGTIDGMVVTSQGRREPAPDAPPEEPARGLRTRHGRRRCTRRRERRAWTPAGSCGISCSPGSRSRSPSLCTTRAGGARASGRSRDSAPSGFSSCRTRRTSSPTRSGSGSWTAGRTGSTRCLIGAAAAIGLVLGFVSIYLVQAVVVRRLGQVAGWALAVGALVLSGVGVYLGRYERWNSWEVLTEPSKIFGGLASGVLDPLSHTGPLALSAFFAVSWCCGYLALLLPVPAAVAAARRALSRRAPAAADGGRTMGARWS